MWEFSYTSQIVKRIMKVLKKMKKYIDIFVYLK